MRKLTASAYGWQRALEFSGIQSIDIEEGMGRAVGTCTIRCKRCSALPGDIVVVTQGYEGTSGQTFVGIVDDLGWRSGWYTVLVNDMLHRAVAYYLVPTPTPTTFPARGAADGIVGWAPHEIVGSLLQNALLGDFMNNAGGAGRPYTGFIYDAVTPEFKFANKDMGGTDIVFEYKSTYDAVIEVSALFGWSVWADHLGNMHFEKRPNYVDSASPVSDSLTPPSYLQFSLTAKNLADAEYHVNTRDTRNSITVKGDKSLSHTAEADEPGASWAPGHHFLPHGGDPMRTLPGGANNTYGGTFRMRAALVNEWLINQTDVSNSADTNLNLLNRLTESMTLPVRGDYRIHARTTCSVASDVLPQAEGVWLVAGVSSHMDLKGSYRMQLNLIR